MEVLLGAVVRYGFATPAIVAGEPPPFKGSAGVPADSHATPKRRKN